ncbi:hypothetical protein [Escherichia coli]|uniref:hypothetical protein n=1 Tax=Escherichia coli TaxID=562 RepID=UPI00388DC0FD
MQLNVDKQKFPVAEAYFVLKQGNRMLQKVDDEIVFACDAVFCAPAGFRRADASGAGRIILRRSLSGEAVASRL